MSRELREEVLAGLSAAVEQLTRFMDPGLIPEVGTNLAFALPGARTNDDVAAVQGRVVLLEGRIHPVGQVAFRASDHVARVVLTAMKFDPAMRSAGNIRYSPQIIEILEGMLLEICSFDREREPPGIRTMDWGVASCCRSGVPDVIFDRGAVGKEPMVRILCENPSDVAAIIMKVSTRMRTNGRSAST